MKRRFAVSVLLVVLMIACVDKIDFAIDGSSYYPVVIDGNITDQRGPYTIRVSKAFDIQSKLSLKTFVNVKSLSISDNQGTNESLIRKAQGIYQTDPNGIRGEVGRVYKLTVELLDGRVYESSPDTLLPSGTVDSLRYTYKEEFNSEGSVQRGFDVFFNSSSGNRNNFHFLWQFTGTYKVDTNPELYDTLCVEARCPKPLPCSGYILDDNGQLFKKGDCECCTCWVNFYNEHPIISDNKLVVGGALRTVKAGYVPINQWTFKYKVLAEIKQLSLSNQTFKFWKAVSEQKNASSSLFLPITGKIPSNFIQVSGPDAPIVGAFYATAITIKSIYITRKAVPNQSYIPNQDFPLANSCLKLFSNSTTIRPTFWEDN